MRNVLFFITLLAGIYICEAGEIVCEANGFSGHLQGIAADPTGIYWSFYDTVVKTDFTGKTLATVQAPRHAGDLCVANGNVYVSIVYYDAKMIKEEGGTGWIYVYSQNLEFQKKVALPDTPRPDGITFLNGKFYIAGDDFGKESHLHNNICIYDSELNFERRVTVDIGKTMKYGAQTLNVLNGKILAGFYASNPSSYLFEETTLKLVGDFPFNVSVGMAVVPPEIAGDRKLIIIAHLLGSRGNCGGKVNIFELKEDGTPVRAELTK